ncbi:MAG: hypothetical protein CVV06_20800 [Gammaproteobacteria bacterium HGW-Gammaproteobacteria-10]|nr:MAG: hypothetical protein CVV06_20800 [Gammaproteobacteria bacterium HGW-Gammaproteobacteria-10]
MVRQAHHERLNLMAVKFYLGMPTFKLSLSFVKQSLTVDTPKQEFGSEQKRQRANAFRQC